MMKRVALLCVLAAVAAACTRKNPEFCTSTADCMDPAKPFCDVNGAFGDLMNDCIATPMDAGADAQALDAPPGGCSPGAALACIADNLTTCSADGHTTTQAACPLGCASAEARCLTFTPSNGLAAALADAAAQPDVVLPQGAKIDTDLGLVETVAGVTITVKSANVTQAGGPTIRVFEARSFVLDDLTIQGSEAVAFVAPGRISVIGKVAARASGAIGGPGAVVAGAACVGHTEQSDPTDALSAFNNGGGGGGNATSGGLGGQTSMSAGTSINSFVPLSGGCNGGSQIDLSGAVVKRGGAGGGAVQLDSLTAVVLSTSGFIDLGAGGGAPFSGGGAGGTIVVEAPAVSLGGAGTGIIANGGAGGACDASGPDANATTSPALAPTCEHSGGNGGVVATAAANAAFCTVSPGHFCSFTRYGGGGGSVGRMRVSTKDGMITESGSPVVGVVVTTDTIVTQ